jgi:hypothetical protein
LSTVTTASSFTCKTAHFGVESRGVEPLASAVQRWVDAFRSHSQTSEMRLNKQDYRLPLTLKIRHVSPDFVPVAAQMLHAPPNLNAYLPAVARNR